MSQHDMTIDPFPNGATVAADISAALVALAGLSSGGTAPTTTFAYQLWADTGTGLLKQRNSANNGWNVLAKLTGVLPGGVTAALQARVLDADLTQVVVTADKLVIDGVLIESFSATLDTNTSAGSLNAIQTGGSWATSALYEIFACVKNDGSAYGLFAMASGGTPARPTGYDRHQHLGWVKTSSGTATNLTPMTQIGSVVTWDDDSANHRPIALANPAGYGFIDVDCSAHVPPNIRQARIVIYIESNGSITAATTQTVDVKEKGKSAGTGRPIASLRGANQAQINEFVIGLDTSRIFQAAFENQTAQAANFKWRFDVVGWIDDKVAA